MERDGVWGLCCRIGAFLCRGFAAASTGGSRTDGAACALIKRVCMRLNQESVVLRLAALSSLALAVPPLSYLHNLHTYALDPNNPYLHTYALDPNNPYLHTYHTAYLHTILAHLSHPIRRLTHSSTASVGLLSNLTCHYMSLSLLVSFSLLWCHSY